MASAGEKYSTQPDVARMISDLTSRIEKLERASPKNQVVFHDTDGTVLMRAGTDPVTEERGFTVGRGDGNTALEVSAPTAGTAQTIKLYDHKGEAIVRDSETYGSGLSRPSLSHHIINSTVALPAQTNTLPYATQAEAYFRKSNPSIEILYDIFSSDGATGVSLKFMELDSGTQLRPRNGIQNYEIAHNPAPAVKARFFTPALDLEAGKFGIGDQIHLGVQAYRFSGVGTYVVQVLAIRGADEV